MFDVSWTELLLVGLVALLMIGPKELPEVIRAMRGMKGKLTGFKNEAKNLMEEVLKESELKEVQASLKNEVETVNKQIQHIVDMNGNLQPTYDISDLLPVQKAENVEQKAEEKKSTLENV